jgi:hypothetical protein
VTTPYLVRVQARRLLLDLVKTAVVDTDIAVVYRWAPDIPDRLVIAGGNIEGPIEFRAMKSGRKPRRDSFDLTVFCAAGPGSVEVERTDLDPTGFEAYDAKVAELIQYVDDVIADDPHLAQTDHVLSASLSNVEGPNSDLPTDGPVSAAIVTVHFEVHHS